LPIPHKCKSAQGFVKRFLEHLAPVLRIAVPGRQGVKIHGGHLGTEFDGTEQIDVLPGNRRNAAEQVDRLLVAGSALFLVDLGQLRRVVVDDRIGDQARAFVPDLLLGFGFDAEPPAVDKRHGAPKSVIGFSPVERLFGSHHHFRQTVR
jgi:hypothetical protein